MLGYCSMDSDFIEMKPTSAMTILMAQAITYRLMNILFFMRKQIFHFSLFTLHFLWEQHLLAFL